MASNWSDREFGYSHEIFPDTLEQQKAVGGWAREYNQLGSGSFRGAVDSLRLGNILIRREHFNLSVEQRTAAPPDHLSFAWLDDDWRVDGAALDPPTFAVWAGPQEHLSVNGNHACGSLVLSVPSRELGIDIGEPWIAILRRDAAGVMETAAWLRSILALAADGAPGEAPEILPDLIRRRLLAIVAHVFRVRAWRPPPAPPRVYRDACEYVADNPGEPIGMRELADAVGASREALHRAFADTVGLTPSAWLRVRRLNGAHRDLRAARPSRMTVSEAAMKWGFWHLGRFSAYYRGHFGHLPSAE
ncbi:MAG: helix-turn-helix transcriptional regulator [Bauldia sp.]|nr:helix-turn-helix transcriptional regulator [Bauldia sp.]